jgi:hypothetical protein
MAGNDRPAGANGMITSGGLTATGGAGRRFFDKRPPNSEILKLFYKCPLMRRTIAVNLFVIAPSAASAAQTPPVLHKLLRTESAFICGQSTWASGTSRRLRD